MTARYAIAVYSGSLIAMWIEIHVIDAAFISHRRVPVFVTLHCHAISDFTTHLVVSLLRAISGSQVWQLLMRSFVLRLCDALFHVCDPVILRAGSQEWRKENKRQRDRHRRLHLHVDPPRQSLRGAREVALT